MCAQGRIQGAAECLLEFANTVNDDVRANKLTIDWLAEFKHRCSLALERVGDEVSDTGNLDAAIAAYSIVLSLGPSIPNAVLVKWTKLMLSRGFNCCKGILSVTVQRWMVTLFRFSSRFREQEGRVTEALKCFQQMQNELAEDAGDDERLEWELDFNARCKQGLEQNGDVAMDSSSYEDAVAHYSTAMTLDPLSAVLLTKRSRARAGVGSWQDSLEDADAAIKLDPSSLFGHERKHAALLGARHYVKAINVYNDMLLMLERSPDPVTRELRKDYVSPSQTKVAIRSTVKRAQRDAPLVVINTKTGRLYDKRERMDEFEADPKFVELVASTTTRLDHSPASRPRILPIRHVLPYLGRSRTAVPRRPSWISAQTGRIIHSSEVGDVLYDNGSVLQESLTSMFKWYHESSLTIVHFKGVRSDLELDGLERSLWNTQAWTLQEFFASRVIRFYTEDWKPYRPDEKVYNHKDSPAIMAEMARATGTDVDVLLSLRPGSDDVRQKLCLAATRVVTKQEDMSYSLFGIFDVSNPVTYGEGQQRAVGRLLQEMLTRSGDVTILAWTGKASDYNSCLPAEISVYHEPASPYVPSPTEDCEMNGLVAELRTCSKIINLAMVLYDRVVILPSPRLVSRRLSLSCIMFPLRALPFEDLMDDDAKPLTPVDGDGGDGNSDAPFSDARPPSSSYTVSSSHHASQLDKLTRAVRRRHDSSFGDEDITSGTLGSQSEGLLIDNVGGPDDDRNGSNGIPGRRLKRMLPGPGFLSRTWWQRRTRVFSATSKACSLTMSEATKCQFAG
ncbi:hypothetical protein HD554DRAFT_2036523 [Boletus coccyginus]|nr:hypothetical protein HD554DRAFT_2036523 [Boletus coccyginus]